MFTFFTQSVQAGAENGVTAGVFVPLAELPGMVTGELSTTGATAEAHGIYAVLNSIYSALAPLPSLGIINLIKSAPVGTGTGRYTEGIGATFQYLLNLQTKEISPLPLPTIGSEAGIGAIYLEDIWAGAAIIANEGAIPGAGLLIPAALVAVLGGINPGAIDTDCRGWIAALVGAISAGVSVRSATVASAIVTRTNPTSSRFAGVAIPPAWYDAVNPITGIVGADLGFLRVVQEAILVEYELLSDPDSQTLELSVRIS
jgi:hypothetical protein